MNHGVRPLKPSPAPGACTGRLIRFPSKRLPETLPKGLFLPGEEAANGGTGRTSYSGKPLLIATIPLQKTSKEAVRAVIWITFAGSADPIHALPLDFRPERVQNPGSGNEFLEIGVLSGRTQRIEEPKPDFISLRQVI